MAIDLKAFAQPLREAIEKLKEADLRLNYVRPEHAHLTLAFFENIPDTHAEKLTKELSRKLATFSFEISLSLGSIGVFPDRRRPKVLWREIIDDGNHLSQLKQRIDEILTSLKLPVENRPFKPHLTLGRIREKNHTPIPESVFSIPLTYSENISIQNVSFFKSELTPSGPRYTVLYRIPLGGNA